MTISKSLKSSVEVSRSGLAAFVPPEATESYTPVAHVDLAGMVAATAQEILNRPLVKDSYVVAREGARMFGLQTFGNGEGEEFGLSIAFRNSYDKSMSIGLAVGFRVFICDNLAISGDIRYMRKHTRNVWDDIEKELITLLFKRYRQVTWDFLCDVEAMRTRAVDLVAGYGMITDLFRQGIMSLGQFQAACKTWECDGSYNVWGCYNAVTRVLKSSPPDSIMWRHQAVHRYMMGLVNGEHVTPRPRRS